MRSCAGTDLSRLSLLLLLGLSLVFASCGENDGGSPGPGGETTEPIGTFELQTEDGVDVSAEGSTLTFNEDGTFAFAEPDCTQTGTFTVSDDTLTMNVRNTSGACTDVLPGEVRTHRFTLDPQGNLTLEESGGPTRTFRPINPQLNGTFELQTEDGVDVSAEGIRLTLDQSTDTFTLNEPDCTQTGAFTTTADTLTMTVETAIGSCPSVFPGDVRQNRFFFDPQGNLVLEETGGPTRIFLPL